MARALAKLARGNVAADVVDSLLAGESRWDSLVVDEDLRWALWQAKAATGRLDEAARAALEADALAHPSAVATSGRLLALAARPDAAVKAAAFGAVISGHDADGAALSNEAISATAAGFQLGSHELLDAHYAAYWPSLEDIWENADHRPGNPRDPRALPGLAGPWRARGSTPWCSRSSSWLDGHPDAPLALRRILLEERDALVRSLAAQRSALTVPWTALEAAR